VGANVHANFNRDRYNFYGYNVPDETEVDKSDIKQAYLRMGLGADLAKLDSENLQADAGLNFGRTSSNLNLAENRIILNGKLRYELSDLLALKIGVSSLLSSFSQFDESSSRSLVKIQPGFETEFGAIKIIGAFNFAIHNDMNNNSELFFAPSARAEIQPIAGLKVYGGIEGDIAPTTYEQITQENPWLGDSLDIRFTKKDFAFFAGANTTFAGFGLHAGFEVASLDDQYFFLNDSTQLEQFNLVYDSENITRISFWTQANYSYRDKWKLESQIKLFNYTTNELGEAYHMPNLEFTSNFSLNIYDKIYGRAGFSAISGIKALDYTVEDKANASVVTLDPVLKLDLGGEYRISPQATGFITFDNVLGRKDSRFLRYPSRGLVVQLGGTYAF
jgi:hypothetical protein